MITLTTDFGYRDPFVGMMKGVILGINPWTVVTDITHGITPHDVREASRVTGGSHRYFPRGTIHVVVVDPGVGSERRPLILKAGGHLFVGPDNGVFTHVLREYAKFEAVHITSRQCLLQSPGGSTFHGRDLFSPVAAWLSKGHDPGNFGYPVTDPVTLDIPSPVLAEGRVQGEVAHVDAFGNCITNISVDEIGELAGEGEVAVQVKGRTLDMLHHYAEAGDAVPHALVNSDGYVEIFVNMGSASEALGVATGEPVSVGRGI